MHVNHSKSTSLYKLTREQHTSHHETATNLFAICCFKYFLFKNGTEHGKDVGTTIGQF